MKAKQNPFLRGEGGRGRSRGGDQREAERRHQFSVLVSALCFHINLTPVIISMQSHHTAGKPGTGADAFVMKQCMLVNLELEQMLLL